MAQLEPPYEARRLVWLFEKGFALPAPINGALAWGLSQETAMKLNSDDKILTLTAKVERMRKTIKSLQESVHSLIERTSNTELRKAQDTTTQTSVISGVPKTAAATTKGRNSFASYFIP